MSEVTPTTQQIVAALKSYLDEYFMEKGDEISGDGPKLPVFTPHEEALLARFWNGNMNGTVNGDVKKAHMGSGFLQEEYPILLTSGLKAMGDDLDGHAFLSSQPLAYKYIDGHKKECPTFLYGTSGAGKTRTVLEFLSRNKGFYFLGGVDLTNNPGSGDLGLVIEDANLTRIGKVGTANAQIINEENRQKITERLSVAILVRYAIHEKVEKQVLKREMTPYEWLLYQLYPKQFLGREDLFKYALEHILVNHQALMTMKHLNPNQSRGKNTTWSVFVDEAQDLISHPQRSGMSHFQSSNGKCRRSTFSAIVDGFSRRADPDGAGQQLYYPVFSGTGLEFDQFKEEARSSAAKGLQLKNLTTSDIVFGDFQVLTADDTTKYLKKFLNLSDVSESVIAHVSEWLRGRPRWVASFIEVYVSRGKIDNFHLAGITDNS